MISQSEAQEVLARYERRIAECARRAVEKWAKLPADHRAAMSPNRTFANVMWAYFREQAHLEFFADPAVFLSDKYGTLSLIFEDRLLVRFKHLDARGRTSNFPTKTSLAFWAQLSLPGIAAALPRLQLCWREDAFRLGLSRLEIVMKNGSSVSWSYPLLVEVGNEATPLRKSKKPGIRGKFDTRKKKEDER